MKKMKLLFLITIIVAVESQMKQLDKEWNNFKSKYNKNYKNETEELSRLFLRLFIIFF